MKAALLIGVLCIVAVCSGVQVFSWNDVANPRTKQPTDGDVTVLWGVSWVIIEYKRGLKLASFW